MIGERNGRTTKLTASGGGRNGLGNSSRGAPLKRDEPLQSWLVCSGIQTGLATFEYCFGKTVLASD
jgi:hypothetical protein